MKPKGRREGTETATSADAGGSYIVRLYRRREDKSEVIGVVESAANNMRRAFVDRDELWTILTGAGDKPAGDPKPDRISDK